MQLQSLKLHHIRSYIDEEIHFPEGSVLLSGDIGSGKSTILLAIEFALFGTKRSDLSGESLLRNGTTQGYVELTFLIDQKKCVIHRALKRSKDVKQVAGYIIENGSRTDGTATELKSKILTLLGYPLSLVTKSKDHIYRYTVYTPQEEMKRILFESVDVRLDTLRKVFGIDRYKRLRENTQVVMRELKEQQRVLQAATSDLDEKKAQMGAQDQEIRVLDLKFKELQPQSDFLELALTQAKGKVEEIEHQKIIQQQKKKEFDLVEQKIQHIVSSRAEYQSELKIVNQQILSLQQELQNVPGGTLNELRQKIVDVTALINQLEKDSSEAQIAITTHQAHLTSSDKVFNQIQSLEECPMCQQQVTLEHKQGIEQREGKIKAKLTSSIANHSVILSQKKDELSQKKKQKESYQEQEKQFALLEVKQKSLTQLKDREEMILKKIDLLKEDLGKNNAHKMSIQNELASFVNVDELFGKLKSEFDQLQTKSHAVRVQIAECKKEKETLLRTHELLKREVTQKEAMKHKIVHISGMQVYFEKHFMGVLSIIERHVMMNIHAEFNQYFQEWFNRLIESEYLSAYINDEFTPVIEQNGYETSAEHLSGGEKTSLALAYRLSLNKVINALIAHIKTRELLILDEPTDGFSTDQLDKVRDLLDQIDVAQVILVSHEPKIESFVDHIIRVEKTDHRSVISSI